MKKFLSVLLAAMMVMSLCVTAGASSLAGTYDVTLWVANEIVDLTKQQVDAFNASNDAGIVINATIEPVSEADAATNMITDVTAGGDIYCFAQDQFARLVQAGALAKLGKAAAEEVINANDPSVVAAAKAGDELYAYPMTADNGYFMYYDKSVIPDADVDSLEQLIADCEAAQKYFAFEMNSSAWYSAAFFFATGCVSEWETDSSGAYISIHDTFNSPEGLIAVKGMKKLVDSPFHLNSSSADSFASNAAIVVTGTWAYSDIAKMLGDNMGVTDLPSFEVDGVSYHLGSYNGCKLMGVKPQEDPVKAAALHRLARYLTGEECQMQRFEARAWGPSNLADQQSEAVQSNPGLAALLLQSPYSVPQGQIHGSWWDIAKVIADDVKAATDDAGLQQALDNYYDKIASLFTMSEAEKNGWSIIGMYNATDGFFFTDYNNETRSNWADDLELTKGDDGLWRTDNAYEIPAGTEFKVRQGKSWDNAFPADNFKVEEAGLYAIQFDEATGEITLIAQ